MGAAPSVWAPEWQWQGPEPELTYMAIHVNSGFVPCHYHSGAQTEGAAPIWDKADLTEDRKEP